MFFSTGVVPHFLITNLVPYRLNRRKTLDEIIIAVITDAYSVISDLKMQKYL